MGFDKTCSIAPGNTYTAAQYNGNITGTVWKTAGSGVNRKYDFTYDDVNRLTAANFTQYNGSGFDVSAGIDFTTNSLTYDANGNILTMNQKGFTVGGSSLIDQLTYAYQTNSNKLSQVTDAVNNPTSLLGDFHYPGSKGSYDYTYDGNGNLMLDNNKAIDKITYNYLNLPQLVHMNGKGNITYTYDASGAKLAKVTSDSTVRHATTTLYIGPFVYQQRDTITNPTGGIDTLQFIAHEEGRTRWAYHKYTSGTVAYKLEYDFFEKDHLGDTRMLLTQQRDTTNYLASMEAAYRSTEVQLFGNITNTAYARASVPGYPNSITITNPNDSVSKVDYTGTSGQKMGPNLLLKVMSGDTVSVAVQSYYNTNTITTTNSSFTDVLNSLANGLVNSTGGAHGTLSNLTASNSSVYNGLTSFLTADDPAPPAGYPKAYLNWIFLDDQFNYVSSSSGAVRAASTTYPAATLNTVAPGAPINITKNGYLYIWVSNETQGWDVFFDNLSVQYKQGPLLEENHYYPFGLTMAGISDKALKTNYAENKYKYNKGSELQTKEFSDGSGLEMYDTHFRNLDPQIGRWWQIDPKPDESQSPYSSMDNNPILHNDPDGDCIPCLVLGAEVVEAAITAVAVYLTGKTAVDGAKNLHAGEFDPAKSSGPLVMSSFGSSSLGDIASTNGQKSQSDKKNVPNPDGAKGKPDHQEKVQELGEKARSENPGKDVIQEKKIQVEGSNRRPDVQVVDPKTGKTVKVYEAERKPQSQRNIKREEEYKKLNIPNETHQVGK